MTHGDQVALFAARLEALMKSTASEFDLTAIEAIGVLESVKARIVASVVRGLPPPRPPQAGQPPEDLP